MVAAEREVGMTAIRSKILIAFFKDGKHMIVGVCNTQEEAMDKALNFAKHIDDMADLIDHFEERTIIRVVKERVKLHE